MSLGDDNLVWDSEVVIEIDPCVDEGISSFRLSQVQTREFANSHPQLNCQLEDRDHLSKSLHREKKDSTSSVTVDDADDENFLYCTSTTLQGREDGCNETRGRSLSRSKKLRRRGVDLARAEPWVSSRRCESEKSREKYRAAGEEKSQPNRIGNHDHVAQTPKRGAKVFTEFKRISRNVRGTLSRSRSRFGNKVPTKFRGTNSTGEETEPPQICSSTIKSPTTPVDDMQDMTKICPNLRCTLRTVYSSGSLRSVSPQQESSSPSISLQSEPEIPDTVTVRKEKCREITPWEKHLKYDLSIRSRRIARAEKPHHLRRDKRPAPRCDNTSSDLGLLLKDEAHLYDNSPPPQLGYASRSSTSSVAHRDIAKYWYLPCIQSVRNNTTQSSLTRSVSSLLVGERLDEIAPSSEFESTRWCARELGSSSSQIIGLNISPPLQAGNEERAVASRSTPELEDTWHLGSNTSRSTIMSLSQSHYKVASSLSTKHSAKTHCLMPPALTLHSLSTRLPHDNASRQSSYAQTRKNDVCRSFLTCGSLESDRDYGEEA